MLIKNADVYDPYKMREFKADILVEKGIIKAVLPENSDLRDEQIIEASGCILVPGFTDVHVHFRDPGFTQKEDIYTGAMAAARGGYTDVVLMANTKPATDNPQTLDYVLNKGRETGINVHACGAVTMGLSGEKLTDMHKLNELGAIGFTDDGIPLMDENLLKEAMEICAALDVPISLHEEDKRLISENGINKGKASEYYNITGSPSEAEYTLIERDVSIALETKVKLNVQHISTKEGVDIVRKARKISNNIYAEVTPHHLALTEEAVIKYGANAKMNPPLRTNEDRLAILEGIKDKTITILATDHAPHTKEEKSGPITQAPSGIIGLETAFSVAYMNLVKNNVISLMDLLEMMCVNPRKLYKLPDAAVIEGNPADFAIIDLNAEYVYNDSCSKAFNTPFAGSKLQGLVKWTVCKGQIVWRSKE